MTPFTYRPTVSLYAMEPNTLGSCANCGEDQPVTGHLYKCPGDRYVCEPCLDEMDDCAEIGEEV